jgi:hypothetical protein
MKLIKLSEKDKEIERRVNEIFKRARKIKRKKEIKKVKRFMRL